MGNPSPTSALGTLRPDLGGSLMQIDLDMDQQGLIANRVAPVIESERQAGTFGKMTVEQLLQTYDTTRTSSGDYNRITQNLGDANFATKEQGIEAPVDARNAAIYGAFFDAELLAAKRARDVVLRNREIRTAALLFNASTWTGASLTTAVGTEWSTASSATPITNVEAAIRKVWEGTGLWPNALIINRLVFRNLRNCAQIIERIAASGAGAPVKPADITEQMIAQCFDLNYVIVAGSAKNSANAGQTRSIAQIWSSEYAMVARVAETDNIEEPCVARTIHWGGDGSQIGTAAETYEDPRSRSTIVRARHETQELVLYPEAAHLLSNITA